MTGARQLAQPLPGRGIPQKRLPSFNGRDEAGAIGTKRCRHDHLIVSNRLAEWPAGARVPQPRPEFVGGKNEVAVGAERGGANVLLTVSKRLTDRRATDEVPEPSRVVIGAGQHGGAVGADRYGLYGTVVCQDVSQPVPEPA